MSANDTIVFEQGAYKVVFDLPTPRPHFIITSKINEKSKDQLKAFLENAQEIYNVLKLSVEFLNLNNEFKKQSVVFSLHTGSFSSMAQFHAHLSVDKEQYISFFNNSVPGTLNGFSPTRQWELKNADIKQAYI
jgi:hypothetical protein